MGQMGQGGKKEWGGERIREWEGGKGGSVAERRRNDNHESKFKGPAWKKGNVRWDEKSSFWGFHCYLKVHSVVYWKMTGFEGWPDTGIRSEMMHVGKKSHPPS